VLWIQACQNYVINYVQLKKKLEEWVG